MDCAVDLEYEWIEAGGNRCVCGRGKHKWREKDQRETAGIR